MHINPFFFFRAKEDINPDGSTRPFPNTLPHFTVYTRVFITTYLIVTKDLYQLIEYIMEVQMAEGRYNCIYFLKFRNKAWNWWFKLMFRTEWALEARGSGAHVKTISNDIMYYTRNRTVKIWPSLLEVFAVDGSFNKIMTPETVLIFK